MIYHPFSKPIARIGVGGRRRYSEAETDSELLDRTVWPCVGSRSKDSPTQQILGDSIRLRKGLVAPLPNLPGEPAACATPL